MTRQAIPMKVNGSKATLQVTASVYYQASSVLILCLILRIGMTETAYLNDTGFGCYLWATGMRFEGRFRLSCPQGGVLREANGAVSQVEYDGTTPIIDNPRAGL